MNQDTAPDSTVLVGITPFHETTGGRGEEMAARWLNRFGEARRTSFECAWDAEMNGLRIEIKTARFSRQSTRGGLWRINIHRHGKLKQAPDVFVFRLEDGPEWKHALHLVVPAQDVGNSKTIGISPRSLLRRWAKYLDAVQYLKAN